MNIYWIRIIVEFQEPMPIIKDNTSQSTGYASGFLQEIGCTGANEQEGRQLIVTYLDSIPWLDISISKLIFDRVGVISKSNVSSEIYNDDDICNSLLSDPLKSGIWYISGRAFFSEDVSGEDAFFEVEAAEFLGHGREKGGPQNE